MRDFVASAFEEAGIGLDWNESGVDEVGIHTNSDKTLVEIDKLYFRPAEVGFRQEHVLTVNRVLGWEPSVRFGELVLLTVKSDLESAKQTGRVAA